MIERYLHPRDDDRPSVTSSAENPTSSYRWATVVLAEPLRIRFDGETNPSPHTPTSLIDTENLSIGERVFVLLYERRSYVIGASGGLRFADPSIRAGALMQRFTGGLMDQQNSPLRVAVIGDSISEGWYSALPTNRRRALGLIEDGLNYSQARGNGWLPAVYVNNALPAEGIASESLSDGGDLRPDYRYGLGRKALYMQNNAWRQWSVTGTSVRVWYWQRPTSHFVANARVLVGGNEVASLTGGAGSVGPTYTDIPLSTVGPHTFRVQSVNAAGFEGFSFILEAIEVFHGDEDHGVHVYDGAHFGYNTLDFMGDFDRVEWKKTLALIDPTLVIVALGTNDALSYSSADYRNYLSTLMFHVWDAIGPDHNYAIVSMPERTDQELRSPWSEYVAANESVAREFGRGISIDVQPWWRTDLTSFDGVHPTEEGQRVLAAAILNGLGR